MATVDDEETPSEIDDYFNGHHKNLKSIALTREYYQQRHQYLIDTVADSKKKGDKHHKKSKRKKSKDKKKRKKSKDKHRHKHKHKEQKDVDDKDIERETAYPQPPVSVEKGWKKHQRIATSAAMSMSPSGTVHILASPSYIVRDILKHDKMLSRLQSQAIPKQKLGSVTHQQSERPKLRHDANDRKQHENDDDDDEEEDGDDDFGVIDIADFAKQISNHDSFTTRKEEKRLRKEEKKRRKREKKERKRKRREKEMEIEKIEQEMNRIKKEEIDATKDQKNSSHQKPKEEQLKNDETMNNKKKTGFKYTPRNNPNFDENERNKKSATKTPTTTTTNLSEKPKVIINDNINHKAKTSSSSKSTSPQITPSKTSPAKDAGIKFDYSAFQMSHSEKTKEIDTDEFHIVVVGNHNHNHSNNSNKKKGMKLFSMFNNKTGDEEVTPPPHPMYAASPSPSLPSKSPPRSPPPTNTPKLRESIQEFDGHLERKRTIKGDMGIFYNDPTKKNKNNKTTTIATKADDATNKSKKDKHSSSDSSDSSSSSSSSDECEAAANHLPNVTISEMALSKHSFADEIIKPDMSNRSTAKKKKYDDDDDDDDDEQENDSLHHVTIPSMALSLMDLSEFQKKNSTKSPIHQSPFFDPNFWNNDFEKRKQKRKEHLSANLSHIDKIDYAAIEPSDDEQQRILSNAKDKDDDEEKLLSSLQSKQNRTRRNRHGSNGSIESDFERHQTLANHSKTVTKMKLQTFAKKQIFEHDINQIFDPQFNQKWINALCGNDEGNVLHLMDTNGDNGGGSHNGHGRKTTMSNWENWDNENITKQSVKNGAEHIGLVPKMIFFSKSFFESKEAKKVDSISLNSPP